MWFCGWLGVGGCVGQFPAKRVFVYATKSEIDGVVGFRVNGGGGEI